MIERYTLPEMGRIWTEEAKFQSWLEVEIAACEANFELGNIPEQDLNTREKLSFIGRFRKKIRINNEFL